MGTKSQRSLFRITDPKFQRDFIVLGVFIAFTSCLLVLTGTWFVIQDIRSMLYEIGPSLGASTAEVVEMRMSNAWTMMIIACAGNVLIVGLLLFIFSNRISGILFRITRCLNDFADGNSVKKIKPRDGDFFLDLVNAANRLFQD